MSEFISALDAKLESLFEVAEKSFAKIDANGRDEDDKTPLHHATTEEVAKVLLKNGAQVNAREKGKGFTPLVFALVADNDRVVAMLRKHGADDNALCNRGFTPGYHYVVSDCRLKTSFIWPDTDPSTITDQEAIEAIYGVPGDVPVNDYHTI